MTLTEIVKEYGSSKDEKSIMAFIEQISNYLGRVLTSEEYCTLCKHVYCVLAGGHFNETFADEQIRGMYYEDKSGKHFAPYWSKEEVKKIYDNYKSKIPTEYNFYDFEVALNMIKSDNYNLMESWFGGDGKETERYTELAINWLDDPDNPFGKEKVWRYFNS